MEHVDEHEHRRGARGTLDASFDEGALGSAGVADRHDHRVEQGGPRAQGTTEGPHLGEPIGDVTTGGVIAMVGRSSTTAEGGQSSTAAVDRGQHPRPRPRDLEAPMLGIGR